MVKVKLTGQAQEATTDAPTTYLVAKQDGEVVGSITVGAAPKHLSADSLIPYFPSIPIRVRHNGHDLAYDKAVLYAATWPRDGLTVKPKRA